MPAKRNRRTSCPTLAKLPPEEPMRRYVNPIPQPRAVPVQTVLAAQSTDLSAAMTQVLEELARQNQLLVDLLVAVNSLTAAALAARNKRA